MSEEIIKVLNELAQRFGIVIDWSSENIMPYMKNLFTRFIKYEQSITMFWLIVNIVLTIISLIILIKVAKYIIKKWNEKEVEECEFMVMFVSGIVSIIFLLVGFLGGICRAEKLIELNCIPEKTIIEYIKPKI